VIISLPDSQEVHLSTRNNIDVSSPSSLSGGSALDKVTTAVRQQRLLIVWDKNHPEDFKKLMSLLREKIDIPARQILIEALVIELDRNKIRDLGLSFGASKDGVSGGFGTGEDGVFNPFTAILQRPALKSVLDFRVRLDALVNEGSASVLSRPSVLVLDGRQARILIGDQIPFTKVISGEQEVTQRIVSSTEYLTVGIMLNLRPRASFNEDAVSMQVEIVISSAGESSTNDETGNVVGPRVQSREVQSTVLVANETPFIIGGLIRQDETNSQRRVPGLGALFRRTNRLRSHKEVIVVLTPHIVNHEDSSLNRALAKDTHLFDSFGLDLYRNIYRVRSEDVFDLDFIHESEFYKAMRAKSRVEAKEHLESLEETAREQRNSKALAEEMASPVEAPFPVLENDWPAIAKRLERVTTAERQSRVLETTSRTKIEPSERAKLFTPEIRTLIAGGVPGEDILVKRMLLGILEETSLETDYEFSRLREERFRKLKGKTTDKLRPEGNTTLADRIEAEKIIFFSSDDVDGAPGKAILEVDTCLAARIAGLSGPSRDDERPALSNQYRERCRRGLEAKQGCADGSSPGAGCIPLLESFGSSQDSACSALQSAHQQALQRRQGGAGDPDSCPTLVLGFPPIGTARSKNFDSPSASLRLAYLDRTSHNRQFRTLLRCLNPAAHADWQNDGSETPSTSPPEIALALPLNTCFENRGKSALNHLRDVLALKRLLDLNRSSLPLTLDAFRAGRELVFPTLSDMAKRKHVVDREAAELFFQTLDYYWAFEQAFKKSVKPLM